MRRWCACMWSMAMWRGQLRRLFAAGVGHLNILLLALQPVRRLACSIAGNDLRASAAERHDRAPAQPAKELRSWRHPRSEPSRVHHRSGDAQRRCTTASGPTSGGRKSPQRPTQIASVLSTWKSQRVTRGSPPALSSGSSHRPAEKRPCRVILRPARGRTGCPAPEHASGHPAVEPPDSPRR